MLILLAKAHEFFIKVYAEAARAVADEQDVLRDAGRASSRFAGRGLGRGDCFRPFTSHASGVLQTFVLGTSLMLAISVPMHGPKTAPTGLMLMAPSGADKNLFLVANSIV